MPRILAAARDHRADLIAMTAHRRGLVDRWFCASVLECMLQETPIHALVLTGPERPGTPRPTANR